jgi:hypothetical protein
MTSRTDRFVQDQPALNGLDNEIREFIQRDVTYLHRTPVRPDGDSQNINSLVQRVAGVSMAEIDHLIGQLREARNALEREGERVQREIAGYAEMNHTARVYIENISDQIAEWQTGISTTQRSDRH